MYKDKKVMCIYGASGAGSTTLGKALAERYKFNQYDTDKYFLKYYEDHQRRMDAMMEEIRETDKNIIITGSFWNWKCDYSEIISYIDLYVRVMLDTDERMKRLKVREKNRFGERIEKNGDMYEQHLNLMKWAKEYDEGDINIRSLSAHKYYEKKYNLSPVIVDSKNMVEDNVKLIEKIILRDKNGIFNNWDIE